jgi:[acyl-carrier-protein] S-malonyltransferase
MSPVQRRLAEVLGAVALKKPNAPVIANATAEPNTDPARIVPLLLSQVTAPVRWVETIQKMSLNGVDTIVELGPGKVLSGLARRIDKGLKVYSVEDPAGLRTVLGEVFK